VKRFAQTIQGCAYANLPVSRYRVWCLEVLRREYQALASDVQEVIRSRLDHSGNHATVLWQDDSIATSGYDPKGEVPFNQAINVYGSGVPR
jgi:hypothetical protein